MEVPHPSLTIIGDVCVDITMGPVDEWPEIGTESIMAEHELRPGGSAGNSALAMQYIGSACRLVTLVGDNHFGRWLTDCFPAENSRISTCNGSTSMSVCLTHSSSERTIFTTRGHMEQMGIHHALETLEPTDHTGDTVLLTGVFLLPRLRAGYADLLQNIVDAGYEIAIDTGWPSGGWQNEIRTEVIAWLPLCKHLLINESEALGLAGDLDLEAAARHIQALMPGESNLVIKRGSRGALGFGPGGRVLAHARVMEVRDSIGAGDSFNAGYLDAWLRGDDLKSALEAGCALAAAVISRSPRSEIGAGELADLNRQAGTSAGSDE